MQSRENRDKDHSSKKSQYYGNADRDHPSVSVETENGKKWLMLNIIAQILVFVFSVNYRNEDIVWASAIFLIASAYFVGAAFHRIHIAHLQSDLGVAICAKDAIGEWSNSCTSYTAAMISLAWCLWYSRKQQPGPFWTTPDQKVCIDLDQTGWATVIGETSNTTYCYHSAAITEAAGASPLLLVYMLFFATLCFDAATYVYMVRFNRAVTISY